MAEKPHQDTILLLEKVMDPIAQPTKRKPLPVLWMGMAFCVGLGIAAVVLTVNGSVAKGLVPALQMTARWAFLLFWLAYTVGAMAALFGPALAVLAKRGREFGLAYASAMTVHFGLVVWLFLISSKPPLSGKPFDFFALGVVFTYLLVVFSFGRLVEGLGPSGWRILRIVGLNYILFAFAWDFVPATIRILTGPSGYEDRIKYAPFAAMCVAAPLLAAAAAAHRRLGTHSARAGRFLSQLTEKASKGSISL